MTNHMKKKLAAAGDDIKSSNQQNGTTELVQHFLTFNDASKSPFHAVRSLATYLLDNGFKHISEAASWAGGALEAGRCYFVTRNDSSIVAFAIGSAAGNHGSHVPPPFTIIAAHTDSPCFKIKPVASVSAHGYLQVGVECYGGGLWHTWFDRDLTVAGRVIVRENNGKLCTKLVEIGKPILRIPNLAIHLSRQVATEGFKINKETDTTPILATELAAGLNSPAVLKDKGASALGCRQPPLLLAALAAELGIAVDAIVDLDLCLADTQPAAIGGVLDEFVFAPRLDNLASCFVGARALVQARVTDEDADSIRVLACFDHEEVGSRSNVGADSSMLPDILRRISLALVPPGGEDGDLYPVFAKSLLVSADMAHAVHPNYAAKHEGRHRPALGRGLVIKTNQNQRYATSGMSGFIVREAARRAGDVPVQEFVVPNDKPCGSTVGPFLASKTGIMTVDVGQPQLSMHSVREMCSVADFELVLQVYVALYTKHVAIMGDFDEAKWV